MLKELSAVLPANEVKRKSPKGLPLEASVRIELHDGVPVMRATESVRTRIQELLEKERQSSLTRSERVELNRFEELDDYLSYINRLVRNQKYKASLAAD